MAKFEISMDVDISITIPVEAETKEEAIKKLCSDDENVRPYLVEYSNIFDTRLVSIQDGETGEILEDFSYKN